MDGNGSPLLSVMLIRFAISGFFLSCQVCLADAEEDSPLERAKGVALRWGAAVVLRMDPGRADMLPATLSPAVAHGVG